MVHATTLLVSQTGIPRVSDDLGKANFPHLLSPSRQPQPDAAGSLKRTARRS